MTRVPTEKPVLAEAVEVAGCAGRLGGKIPFRSRLSLIAARSPRRGLPGNGRSSPTGTQLVFSLVFIAGTRFTPGARLGPGAPAALLAPRGSGFLFRMVATAQMIRP